MCTVTYIVQGANKYFTSNRDENKLRPVAAMPQTIDWNGKNLTFPKDPHAGGSWFAVAENGTIGILLNGAFEKHVPDYPYRKSRGLLLLELVAEDSVPHFVEKYDFTGIEPFTIVLFRNEQLFEFRWDGHRKFRTQLSVDKNQIWSSSTLYDAAAIKKREALFKNFTSTHTKVNAELLHNFHSNDNGDDQNGFIINRENGIKTQSITQAILQEDQLIFIHHDLNTMQKQEQFIQLKKYNVQ